MIPFEAICDVETEKLEVQSRGGNCDTNWINKEGGTHVIYHLLMLLADALKVACLHVRDTGDPYTWRRSTAGKKTISYPT